MDPETYFMQLCSKGDNVVVEKYLQNHWPKDQILQSNLLLWGIAGAGLGNHIDIAKYLIQCGANKFELGLWCACTRGHMEYAEFMIECGATDVNIGLRSACLFGRRRLIKYMIQLGADDFNKGLESACYGGHINTAKFLVQCGANDFNQGLYVSCYGKLTPYGRSISSFKPSFRRNVAEYMIKMGANNFRQILEMSYNNRYVDVMKFLSKYIELEQKHRDFLIKYAHWNLIMMELAFKERYVIPELKRYIFEFL